MKVKKILAFMFVFTLAFVSCNKSEDSLDESLLNRDISARPPTVDQRHQQIEPHSLHLEGTQFGVIKNPVLNDLMSRHLEFTIETVFTIDEYSDFERYILSYFEGRGIQLYLVSKKLYFRINSNEYLIYDGIESRTCYQVSIARKQDGFIIFYINGHPVAYEFDASEFSTSAPLFIGSKDFGTNDIYTTGIIIDEIRFWKRYFREPEINNNLFTNIIPVDYLLGYYNFNNEPLRDTFLDFSEYDYVNFAHQRDGIFYGGVDEESYDSEMECITFR